MIRARFLMPWLIVGLYFSFAPGELTRSPEWIKAHPDDPLPEALAVFFTSLVLLVPPAIAVWWAGSDIRDLYGRFPSGRTVAFLIGCGIPSVGLSLVAFYLVFAPLSFGFPQALQTWFSSAPMRNLYSPGPPYPLLGNVAGFLAMVVVGPIAEEWFVRGLLLARWSAKVGILRAIIRTSVVFALLHPNPVDAFVFSFAMCGLYARFDSLWAPTLVHASHNAIVWCLAAIGPVIGEPTDIASFAQVWKWWWLPAIGLLLMLPWALRLRGRYRPMSTWRFPVPRATDNRVVVAT